MSEPQKQSKAEAPAKMVTILVNNQERLELIGVAGGAFLGSELGPNGGRGILPGLNLVDPDLLRTARENTLFNSKFTETIQPSLAPEARSPNVGKPLLVQGKDAPASSPFSKLTPAECFELIKTIATPELCSDLLKSELREEVRLALKQRGRYVRSGNEGSEEDAA